MNEVPLANAVVRLRRFTPGDAPVVQVLAGDVAVADTTLNIAHPYLPGAAAKWIAGHDAGFEHDGVAVFAVTSAAEGVLVGCISVSVSAAHRHGEIGYWVGRPFWNRGYATAALVILLRYCFQARELHRVYAHHMARNPASGRVLEKAGLRREGTLREHIVKAGRYEDIVLYGMLRADFANQRHPVAT